MKKPFRFIFIVISLLLFYKCNTSYRMIEKQRTKRGNEILFLYFKNQYALDDPYYIDIKKEYKFDIDSVIIYYFGSMTEVTNKQYWKFLSYLKENKHSDYDIYKPKTYCWKSYSGIFDFADTMSKSYDNLESYGDYPIVNITPDDALAFVGWLNEIEIDSTVRYRLFTTDEWLDFFSSTKENSFTWEGDYWRNKNGFLLANFSEFNQNQIRYDQLNDTISFEDLENSYTFFVKGPQNVWSYNPNEWGAFNMCGNVAELTTNYFKKDSVWYCKTHGGSWNSPIFYLKKTSTETYKIPSPFVGLRILKMQLKLR